jgi:signal transduction histidine kinase
MASNERPEATGAAADGTTARTSSKIVHDLNNTITTITVYSELVRAGLPADSPLLPDLELIESSAAEAARLVRSLRAVAAPGTPAGADDSHAVGDS